MTDKKIIGVLLVFTIIMSVFSIIVTLNFNTDNLPKERTTTIIKSADAQTSNLELTVEKNTKTQNE